MKRALAMAFEVLMRGALVLAGLWLLWALAMAGGTAAELVPPP